MPPMLSVCLIARNEESSLPRALKSVRDVAGEIIVADTGSTDATAQVAKDLGAIVCHFPWCDDFSAARNFTVSQARGDWIFWLDADEELLPESVAELPEAIARPDVLAYLVRRQDLQRADRLDYFTMMWQLRLFRRRDDLRFQGRCHPHFKPDIEDIIGKTGLQLHPSSITLRHYGYIGELRPAKLRRAARLLELELRERPGQLYYLTEYGHTLLALGETRRAHEILSQTLEEVLARTADQDAPQPMAARVLEYFLPLPADRLPAGVTPESLADLARRWFPSSGPLVWLLARQAAIAGRYNEAEKLLRRLVQMGKDHSYDPWISFTPGMVGDDAKLNLGVCLIRLGRLEEARQVFTELLASPEHAAAARDSLASIEQLLRYSGTGPIRYSFG